MKNKDSRLHIVKKNKALQTALFNVVPYHPDKDFYTNFDNIEQEIELENWSNQK